MANLLDAYRLYFRALTRACLGPRGDDAELEAKRLEARLARTTMEASVERYRAEPGASPQQLDRLMSMLASSHRFAHAAMSLEAEMSANPERTLPPGFCRFSDNVDRTLELQASTLRGQHIAEADFPDLREAHTQLLQNGGQASALLNTETDRIANSLNTLGEQIMAWMAG
jgi:uncharacterized membrane protein YccC